MNPVDAAVLVVAKAPIPGVAKTRLAEAFGMDGAAELAAAALLDTLIAVRSADVSTRIVALTGDLSCGRRSDEIRALLAEFTVIPQQGSGFAERLHRAHRDAAVLANGPVLQIGMDTPQASPDLLTSAATVLSGTGVDAVFGPATDGGWWALGLTEPERASVLRDIAMSQADTGAATLAALHATGSFVAELPTLTDVDTADDVQVVAGILSVASHFRRAAGRLSPVV